MILTEPHRTHLPEAHNCLRANVWELIFGEYILDLCCWVSSAATGFFWYHDPDMGFKNIHRSHVPGEPAACRLARISVEGIGVGVHSDEGHSMFQTLMNVQSEDAMSLLVPIENRNDNLPVGLRTITYTVGWYNVELGETFSWRASSNNESRRPTRPHSTTVGLYGIEDLINLLEGGC